MVVLVLGGGEADSGDVIEGDAVGDAVVPRQPVMQHYGRVAAQDPDVELLCWIIGSK